MAAATTDGAADVELPPSPETVPTTPDLGDDASRPTEPIIPIRLSNTSLPAADTMQSPDAIIVEDHTNTDIAPVEQVEPSDASPIEGSVSDVTFCNEPEETETEEAGGPTDRYSTPDNPTIDIESDNECSPKNTRTIVRCASRSGTEISEASGGVDWDELEKTEEQEPRDEGSDEVGCLFALHVHLGTDIHAVHGFPSGSSGARK